MDEYGVLLTWDDEARVRYRAGGDIPGLILESGSLDGLTERARRAAPELLELMGRVPAGASLSFMAERGQQSFEAATGNWLCRKPVSRAVAGKNQIHEFTPP